MRALRRQHADSSHCAGPMHLEHMASHSLTRLYIVVSKAVAEDTLEYLFGVFEGLEYVDLKRDHVSGLSRVRASALQVLGYQIRIWGFRVQDSILCLAGPGGVVLRVLKCRA